MSTTKIEGPYRHGTMWRCRVKDEAGRRWCRAAETPEEARRIAEDGVEGAEGTEARGVVEPPADATTASRPPSPMRIEGPFAHGAGYRCRVLTATGPRWCPVRPTRDHAYKLAEQVVQIAMQDGQLSVKDAVKAYLDYQTSKGNRTGSVTTSGQLAKSPRNRRIVNDDFHSIFPSESVGQRTFDPCSSSGQHSMRLPSGLYG